MADGSFQHLGFSFHDRYEVFQEIVDAYANWTFCQIQYNFMDEEHQAGTRGLRYAANKGLAVVVMEPLRGGGLATPPPEVQAIWDGAPHWRSAADWGLRWVWNHPEVSLALSGMSSMQQVDQNVASAEESGIGLLSADELALIARVRDAYRGLCPVPCTDCQYCQPCASGVNIPAVFKTYNEGLIYGQQGKAKWLYGLLDETQRANHCTECGECEELCPQGIAIREWLKKAHEFMQ